jgi:hypothetical protein
MGDNFFVWLLNLFPFYRDEKARLLARNVELQVRIGKQEDANQGLREALSEVQGQLVSAREAFRVEEQARILAEDRVQSAIQDRDRLWDLVKESLAGERFALQTQVNHANQKTGGGVVYENAHALPTSAVPKPQEGGPVGRRGRMMPSQMAAEMQRVNLEEYLKAHQPLAG